LLLGPLLCHALVPALDGEAEHPESVGHQVPLDLEVEGGVRCKAGRVVYLKEPGLAKVVDEDVETENLKAHRVLEVVGLGTPIRVGQGWLSSQEGLYNDVLDARPDLL
jgi:hypothetical protein